MCNKGKMGGDEGYEKYRESRIINWIRSMCLPLSIHFHFVTPIPSLHLMFLAVVGIEQAIGASADNFTPISGNDTLT